MKYIPKGYTLFDPKIRLYWKYTGDENTILNARQYTRVSTHKHIDKCYKSGCDLFERKPLWELMGKTKLRWTIEHFLIKWRTIFRTILSESRNSSNPPL